MFLETLESLSKETVAPPPFLLLSSSYLWWWWCVGGEAGVDQGRREEGSDLLCDILALNQGTPERDSS